MNTINAMQAAHLNVGRVKPGFTLVLHAGHKGLNGVASWLLPWIEKADRVTSGARVLKDRDGATSL